MLCWPSRELRSRTWKRATCSASAASRLLRADFSYARVKASNVEARNVLSVDALKLVQPVDVVFRLE